MQQFSTSIESPSEVRDRSSRPFVCIHLGMPKTATTMLQQFLFSQHSEIYALGKLPQLVPNPYPLKASQELSQAVQAPNHVMPEWAMTDLRLRTRTAAEKGQISVFSKEGMSGSPPGKQRKSADLLQEIFGPCRILLTIREPLSFMEALYFQHLKAYQKDKFKLVGSPFGDVPRFFTIDEWFVAISKAARNTVTHLGLADTADLYAAKFGRGNVKVLIYEQLKQDPDRFLRELCGFLDINEEEARFLSKKKSANVRWTETPIRRLKELQSCRGKSLLFKNSSLDGRASMLGLNDKNDTAPKARAPMSAELERQLLDLSREQLCRLEREWGLPLREYGYRF